MEQTLYKWLLDLPVVFLQFGTWLTTPLPYVNLTPLAMIGFTGISIVIGALLLRLFVGG